jgi:RNA-directed DNA polymerase
MCATRQQAEAALERLRVLLADLGLEPKAAKTRIVHLEVGGEGLDFLGFHHRLVRSKGMVGKRDVTFLARWPARRAMQHARDRIRELTVRSRLLFPVETVVTDVNLFLRGWSAYFRYGNSARHLDISTSRHDQGLRGDAPGGVHRQTTSPHPGLRQIRDRVRIAEPARLDHPARDRRRTQALPGLAGETECRR